MQKLASTSRPPGFSSRARASSIVSQSASDWARNRSRSAGAAPTACTWSAIMQGRRLSQCMAVAENPKRERGVGKNLPVEARTGGADEHAGNLGERRLRLLADETLGQPEQGREIIVRQIGIGERDLSLRLALADRADQAAYHVHRGAAVGGPEIGNGKGFARLQRRQFRRRGDHEIAHPVDHRFRAHRVGGIIARPPHGDRRAACAHAWLLYSSSTRPPPAPRLRELSLSGT